MHPLDTPALNALNQLLPRHLEQENEQPVRPPRSPESLRKAIDVSLGREGVSEARLLQAARQILDHTPSTASRSFFNQLFAGRDQAALLGDWLASALNNSMYTWKVGGVHVLLEELLIQRMGEMMGLKDADGSFTPGGSLSNLLGMLLARNHALPGFREFGGDTSKLRIYTSADCHYSVRKAAGILGIGRSNVVFVPTDDQGRMRADALDKAIATDEADGLRPCMINATAGTTVLGAWDPIDAIADVAKAHDVWLHVDAAYGGSMVFHPELKEHLTAAHRADSITWDAHKMMGVPLICSVVLVRERGLLQAALDESASYLFQGDADRYNPGKRSLQCGRRNDALKLWMAWKRHGDAGYQARMESLRNLALCVRDHVTAHGDLTLVREPASINVVFTVDGVDADELCRELNERGLAMVGHAIVDDQPVVRMVTLNPDHTEDDIAEFFQHLHEVAGQLREDGERKAS